MSNKPKNSLAEKVSVKVAEHLTEIGFLGGVLFLSNLLYNIYCWWSVCHSSSNLASRSPVYVLTQNYDEITKQFDPILWTRARKRVARQCRRSKLTLNDVEIDYLTRKALFGIMNENADEVSASCSALNAETLE
jgi:hypothetical protein